VAWLTLPAEAGRHEFRRRTLRMGHEDNQAADFTIMTYKCLLAGLINGRMSNCLNKIHRREPREVRKYESLPNSGTRVRS